ncbi:CREB3 regulatory factor-like isoform X2 [Amblyraja radiata]|uniref:CREB3 regulatory factor-like isoform X2 n=1 Tax=Amblyraja radiata TaxID=386614 RepID=UPI0014041AD2|nr:CREB3 regulatory factor-like isoform X2 [Amblyraja radiata]
MRVGWSLRSPMLSETPAHVTPPITLRPAPTPALTPASCMNSSRNDLLSLSLYQSPVREKIDLLSDLMDDEPADSGHGERWDVAALDDFTRFAKADLWSTKEMDLLGLDQSASPYQNEARLSQTPTLAELNAVDSQPVSDSWCLLRTGREDSPFSGRPEVASRTMESSRKPNAMDSLAESNLQSEGVVFLQRREQQLANLKTTMPKDNEPCPVHPEAPPTSEDRVLGDRPPHPSHPSVAVPGQEEGTTGDQVGPRPWRHPEGSVEAGSVALEECRRDKEDGRRYRPPFPAWGESGEPRPDAGGEVNYDEHNYSLFSVEGLGLQPDEGRSELEDGSDTDQDGSQNEDEEGDDYDDDKDDFSDYLSEAGNELEVCADVASDTGGRRLKRRYFWEYSDSHATPSKQERILQPSEWDSSTLPSNVYLKENGVGQGRRMGKKSRRTDVDDLTPNPRKLLYIGDELKKLNKVIEELRPVSELPLNVRPRSRKEKNKLASRACRLKKKAQHEANKIKLWGLNIEHDNLLQVIVAIKHQIMRRVEQRRGGTQEESMAGKLQALLHSTVGRSVAGHTSEFVSEVLEKVSVGEAEGNLSWRLSPWT